MSEDFNPNSVACMRGKLGKATYDAEIVVNGVHYLVSRGHSTSAEAKSSVEPLLERLRVDLRAAGSEFVKKHGFSRAKE